MSTTPDPSSLSADSDLSLRKHSELALQACEARYRTLFEYAQVGVVLADTQSYYIDANACACQMLGYSRDELIGLHATDIVVPSEAPSPPPLSPGGRGVGVRGIEKALDEISGQSDHRREWQFRRKDGSVFWADVLATQMPDGTLLGMIRDLSDPSPPPLSPWGRGAGGEGLHDTREQLAAIVETSSDAIFSTTADGRITSWNAGATAIYGYNAEEMMGADIARLFPADRLPDEALLQDRLRSGERVEPFETVCQTRAGLQIDVSVAAAPLRISTGQFVGTARIVRDISVRKDHERELARMTRLYAALSQVNQAIVWSPSRDELFRKVCEALVVHGGFRMAWIGWHDPETQRLLPVAECGDEDGFLQSIAVYVDDRPEGRGPSGIAFRSGRPYICNDALNDQATLPWRAELERRALRSSAAFPIRVNGEERGTLHVYADARGFFQSKEIALVEEAAADVSFALDNFDRDEARRRAERTLRSEKQFSDTMIESMPGILYFYDGEGRFLRWNRNFELVSGYSAEEIARMHPLDFFKGKHRTGVQQRIEEVFATGESSIEADFAAKDGTLTPYYFTGRLVVYEGRTCLVGVGIDISDRRRAEDQLTVSEQKYRELVEHANSIILRWNSAGQITFLNEFGQRFFGYSAAEIVGRNVTETIVPPTESGGRDLRQLMDDICTAPESYEQSINENVRRNGERVWISWTNRILRDPQEQVVEILSVGTDITDRIRMEAERERRHRAEAADRIKSAFLATMSHELRTPLNSIIGFTGIILQGLAGPLNAEQGKQLNMVRSSARHLLALVNDVLDISKIEAGQLEVAREPFDLCQSITKVLALVRPQAEARQLEMRVELAPELGEAISDERRFEQILLNLLSNAIKFTERGTITLTAQSITDFLPPRPRPSPLMLPSPPGGAGGVTGEVGDEGTDAETGQPAIRLQVTDTGMGIKPEDLLNLFQPFRQIDSGLSRSHEGTGLGLAICRRLAALMGGEIHAASEWGKGSTFSVTLPLSPIPPHPTLFPAGSGQGERGKGLGVQA